MYKKRVAKAKLIIEKKPNIGIWCMTDLKAFNISLKRKGDEGVAKDLPSLKVQYNS